MIQLLLARMPLIARHEQKSAWDGMLASVMTIKLRY